MFDYRGGIGQETRLIFHSLAIGAVPGAMLASKYGADDVTHYFALAVMLFGIFVLWLNEPLLWRIGIDRMAATITFLCGGFVGAGLIGHMW